MISEPDLKSLRLHLGWSQERMAEELGLDRSSVSRMENGIQVMSKPVRRLVGHLVRLHGDLAVAISALGSQQIDCSHPAPLVEEGSPSLAAAVSSPSELRSSPNKAHASGVLAEINLAGVPAGAGDIAPAGGEGAAMAAPE